MKTVILALLLASGAQAWTLTFAQGTGKTKGKLLQVENRVLQGFISPTIAVGALNTGNIQGGGYNKYIEGSIDLRVEGKSGIMIQVQQGIAHIHHTTDRLGHNLQWPTTVRVGVAKGNQSISFFWKHFSSGKLSTKEKPNKGQEYIGISVGF